MKQQSKFLSLSLQSVNNSNNYVIRIFLTVELDPRLQHPISKGKHFKREIAIFFYFSTNNMGELLLELML